MKIGIVGINGFGGGELLRLVAGHPQFKLAYAGGANHRCADPADRCRMT